jgi:Cytochrome P460
MRPILALPALLTLLPMAAAISAGAPTDGALIEYTPDGAVVIPADYREWIFLTSSLDLNYNAPVPGAAARASLLDNVFVNPTAYAAFTRTGQWPDKTVLVKENRRAASAGTLSKSGKFQTEIASMELHVKDARRFPGQWAFFVSDGKQPGRYLQPSESCYSCHAEHGAVDTTFVQFYPTLLSIATQKGTLAVAPAR